jgi:deoxyribodipyrimidine photo-lyase
MMVDPRRVRECNTFSVGEGPVLYFMRRDQRVEHNWALLYAQEKALERKVPLIVLFNLEIIPERSNLRQYDFLLTGLEEVEQDLKEINIPFFLTIGKSGDTVPAFIKEHGVSELVMDFNPLHYALARRDAVLKHIAIHAVEVDARNIIPCWHASDKEEFAAYTFRPKVHRKLTEFLTKIPAVKNHPYLHKKKPTKIAWDTLQTSLPIDRTVAPAPYITPGSQAAKQQLKKFITSTIDSYDEVRNDPTQNGVSGLSPYLHFGHISAQHVAWVISNNTDIKKEAREAFLEELIVRRELADNYCLYNKNYDKVTGAHAWAQKTILEHKNDPREHVYTKDELEAGVTHDDLWNAMQNQMVTEGKMHGWCRMYWGKKILEWTPDVQTAIDIALYLNDKYELDGLDPNGVTGVMWSLCGVHDRAWNERPIFGKIRYMNYAGAKRKFDIKAYIARYGKNETLFT